MACEPLLKDFPTFCPCDPKIEVLYWKYETHNSVTESPGRKALLH